MRLTDCASPGDHPAAVYLYGPEVWAVRVRGRITALRLAEEKGWKPFRWLGDWFVTDMTPDEGGAKLFVEKVLPKPNPRFIRINPPRYLYHSTPADNLPLIAEAGLLPSREPNWGGMLGDQSIGRIYAAPTPEMALFYGNILFRDRLRDNRFTHIPLILRITVKPNQEWVKEAQDRQSDFYLFTPIPQNLLRVFWQERWRPLDWAKDRLVELAYSRNDELGEFVDWEGNPVGEDARDAHEDIKKLYQSWGLIPEKQYAQA